jgi:hypothetical protein
VYGKQPVAVLGLALAFAATAGALPAGASDPECAGPNAWRESERWSRLRRGMHRTEVLRVLGEPGVVASYDAFERWEYPDLRGGRLHFDERGALIAWRRPPEPRERAEAPQ